MQLLSMVLNPLSLLCPIRIEKPEKCSLTHLFYCYGDSANDLWEYKKGLCLVCHCIRTESNNLCFVAFDFPVEVLFFKTKRSEAKQNKKQNNIKYSSNAIYTSKPFVLCRVMGKN